MRKAFAFAICGLLASAGIAVAQDTVDESLSAFVTRCRTAQAECMSDLSNGFLAARGMKTICPPAALSADDAARREMAWLHNAAANAALAQGKEIDAEWKALHTLWPCPH
ncbi:MAG: hypothetical protein KGI68_12385 [Alphaproteobacteria bacterium]|nr:hypothetical protein [Alphaproteobacteria bacterium]MDE1985000.1 hypothetical protein [Alphaproteobacteria bacterium]MDE2162344.1 hypothetical protein [Alphaproteobacteria bacterium]MDE2501137.1 hypothetical protein [Alphaproteobacteria bacterium]